MSRVLWWVTNGRAAAPPAIGCIIGVSTSMYPRPSKNFLSSRTIRARVSKISRDLSVAIKSRYRMRYRSSMSVSPCHFSGSGSSAFDKKNSSSTQTELAGLCAVHMPAHTNVVAQIQQLKKLEAPFANHIFLHVNLDSLPAALQMGKTRFPHQPVRNDSPRHSNFLFLRFQFPGLRRRVLAHQIRRRVAPAKFPWKCFKSKSLYLLQLFLALFKLVTRLELQGEVPFPSGCKRSIKASG